MHNNIEKAVPFLTLLFPPQTSDILFKGQFWFAWAITRIEFAVARIFFAAACVSDICNTYISAFRLFYTLRLYQNFGLELVPDYFFTFRLPNAINPTMPAPNKSITTSSEIGSRFIAKMLKLKASAFWAIVKKDKPNNVQNVFNFLCPFLCSGSVF